MTTPLNQRERFLRTMRYQPTDMRPLNLVGFWPDTLARWRREGLPADTSSDENLDRYFGIQQRLEVFNVNYAFGIWPSFETRVLERTEEFTISIDTTGRTVRNFNHHTSFPEWIDFPVKNGGDLRRYIDERVKDSDLDARFPAGWEGKLRAAVAANKVIMINGGGYYWTLRSIAGVEVASYLLYDERELVEELFDRLQVQIMEGMRRTLAICTPDVVGYGEDLAYKNGPLLSPDMFRQMILPRYKLALDLAHAKGMDLTWYDSDGDLRLFIPDYLSVGINGLAPCEVAAEMDPVALRRQFGRELRLIGGFDKRLVAQGKKAIDAEFARLRPVIQEGGYVPSIDHSVSADISLDNYRYYLDAVQKALVL
jgi:uroporphyrinogen decarboxylase